MVIPPRLYWLASPLMEGDLTPWDIEKVMPSQGEGEQSTKFGGPCPYWPHPPLCCRLLKEFPPPPLDPTVMVTGVVAAPPHLSHSSMTVLYLPALSARL